MAKPGTAERLFIVVPCYNEQEVLPETSKQLKAKLESLIRVGSISADSRLLFVNDGSKDNTWPMIQKLHKEDKRFSGVNLSRNKGHQNALLAGLTVAVNYADVIISMDADLQDDVDAVDKMIEEYKKGFDVVYGVRESREHDRFFKRASAEGFYRLMKALGVDIVFNHADYRLMSKRAIQGLLEYDEVNLFLRGIVPQIGFPFTTVEYARKERFAGESKYPLKKMLSFALDGITSFSIKPIRLIMAAGVLMSLIGLCVLLWVLGVKIAGHVTDGWTSMMGSIWILAGIQMLSLGLIGEYIGKIYAETKHRPRFIIESILNTKEEEPK